MGYWRLARSRKSDALLPTMAQVWVFLLTQIGHPLCSGGVGSWSIHVDCCGNYSTTVTQRTECRDRRMFKGEEPLKLLLSTNSNHAEIASWLTFLQFISMTNFFEIAPIINLSTFKSHKFEKLLKNWSDNYPIDKSQLILKPNQRS